MPALKPCANNCLYAITDYQNFSGAELFSAVENIVTAGCRIIQYRNKSNNHTLRAFEAQEIKHICHKYNAKLIINDDIHLAKFIHADGVHLGQADDDANTARKALGARAIIGITCHNSLDYAEEALKQGADYVAFGRFFPSATKPNASIASTDLLQQARMRWPHATLVAIGGITQNSAPILLSQGADYVAISHDVFNTEKKAMYVQTFNTKELL